MLQVNERIEIADGELVWKFVRSGGPGGQNVNKVASKAVLFWDMAASPNVPADVKQRLTSRHRRLVTKEGGLVLTSQKYRDQDRNRDDCLEKLRALLLEACVVPKPRKKTRPSRGARQARLNEKKRRSSVKSGRQRPVEE